jgi:hypothetical protein
MEEEEKAGLASNSISLETKLYEAGSLKLPISPR